MQIGAIELKDEEVGHRHLQLSQQVCANKWCRAMFKPKMCEKNGTCRLSLRCDKCCARNAAAQKRYIHTGRGRYFRETWEQTERSNSRKRNWWSSRQGAEGMLGEKDSLVSTATFNSACTSLVDDLGWVGDVECIEEMEELEKVQEVQGVQDADDTHDSRSLEDIEKATRAKHSADVDHVPNGKIVHETESGQTRDTSIALLAVAPSLNAPLSIPNSACESILESTPSLWHFFRDYTPYFQDR